MEPIKRKRPFLPKTKSGCLTCKIRKVKCDEAKPACRRCTSTGRKCDGYASRSTDSTSPPSAQSISPPLPAQSDLFSSEAEKRSFYFFQARASQELGGYFSVPFWSREVFQAAIHYPSTRHLVIAIGAAYEGFETAKSNKGNSSDYGERTKFALQQSNHSIKLLGTLFDSATTPGTSIETTCSILTASILFAYLACLQGHLGQAIQHVRSGLKVLQDFENVRASGETSPGYPIAVSQLRSLLISIYGQVRCMINDESLEKWDRDPLVSQIDPVESFTSLSEAHNYVESLFHNMLALLQKTELHPPTTTEQVATFTARRDRLLRALASSSEALDSLSSRLPPDPSGRVEKGVAILRLYHTLIGIRLGINALQPALREAAFDGLQPELEQMLQYCELLVKDDGSATPQRPSCSAGLGFVMPLHTIAARCRNPRLRRRALQILLNSARRECLWDGILTGKIVAKTLEIEERASSPKGLSVGKVPDGGRVREVKIEFEGERKARLRYVTVEDWKTKKRGQHHIIEW